MPQYIEQENTIDKKIIEIALQLPENLFDKFTSAVDKFNKAILDIGSQSDSFLIKAEKAQLAVAEKLKEVGRKGNFSEEYFKDFNENFNEISKTKNLNKSEIADTMLKSMDLLKNEKLKLDGNELIKFAEIISKTAKKTGEGSEDIIKAVIPMLEKKLDLNTISSIITESIISNQKNGESFLDLVKKSDSPKDSTSHLKFDKITQLPETLSSQLNNLSDKFGSSLISFTNKFGIVGAGIVAALGLIGAKLASKALDDGINKIYAPLKSSVKKISALKNIPGPSKGFFKDFNGIYPKKFGISTNQNPLANSSNKNNLATLATMVLKKLNTLFNKLKKIFSLNTNSSPKNQNPPTNSSNKKAFATLAAVGTIATVGTLGLGGAAIYKNRQKKNHNENNEAGEDILDIDPIANFEDGSEKIGFFSEKLNNLGIDLNSIQTKMSGFGLDFLSLGSIFMSNPIGLAIGAIGGAIYLLVKHFDSVKAALAPFTQFFLDKFSPIINAFQTLWGAGKKLFSLFSSEKQTMSEFGDEAQESAGMFEIAGNIISEIGKIISSAIDLAFLPLEIAINLISAVIETFTRWFNSDISFFDALSSSFKDVFGSFDIFGRIIDHVKLIWSDFYKAILGGINFVGNAVNKVKSWFGFGDKTYEKIDKELNLATNIGNPYPNFMDNSGTIPDHSNAFSTIGSINQASQIQKICFNLIIKIKQALFNLKSSLNFKKLKNSLKIRLYLQAQALTKQSSLSPL